MTDQQTLSDHDRAFVVPSNHTPLATAAIQAAISQGNKKLFDRLTCGMAASPSVEELEAELGREFIQQVCDVEIVSSADNRTAGGALDEVDPVIAPLDSLSFL